MFSQTFERAFISSFLFNNGALFFFIAIASLNFRLINDEKDDRGDRQKIVKPLNCQKLFETVETAKNQRE